MAVVFQEGFDHYSTATEMGSTWTIGSAIFSTFVVGRFGGKALSMSSSITLSNVKTLPSNLTTFVFGVALAQNAISSVGTNNFSFQFRDGATPQLSVVFNAVSMIIEVRSGTTSGTLLGSFSYPSSNFFSLEVKVTINNTTGSVEARMNGTSTPVLNLTSVNTRGGTSNAYINQLSFNGVNNGSNFYLDDLYVLSTSGDAPTNFVGDARIITLIPSAAGSSTQWTPLSSTNVSNVDETTSDVDTTYNSSATVGQKDLYAMTDLTVTPTTIHAVQIKALVRKDDATSREVQTRIKSGATETGGTSTATTSTYAMIADLYTLDPNTSAAWTAAAVNALEAGVQVTV